ncbi:NADP-dependent malic enzyme [Magnetospira thiophila]
MDDKSSPLDMDREALLMHAAHPPGKVSVEPTKPLTTQRDLSLAYSPGVAAPCREIHRDPSLAYDYTAKGNLVAVISNGTAVLGLGNLGALASKPVMEGKAVLFKRFADVNSIDLELETEDVDEFINAVKFLGPSFGGINLEDIKAPECFIIEQRLRELMDIPVFHDDQHGTAIISSAGLINACDLTGRKLSEVKLVCNGAGAAAIACIELVKAMGVKHENVILCDSKGVIYQGREEGMNQWKSAHAVATDKRTLAEALDGADAFFGLSVKGAVTAEMAASMAPNPIIFAMANPDPEILPAEVKAIRSDAIMATGRSDFPNQVNNVLGFPYIFRGALDVRARTINEEMKIAAAHAIAALAREDVPDEVGAAYAGQNLKYGPEYIIPAPFDPRLIAAIPPAVAQAAMDTGVAQKPILDMDNYRTELSARLDPTVSTLQNIFDLVKAEQPRVVFAEGEEEKSIRAAITFRNLGYGQPILVGREDRIARAVEDLGLGSLDGVEITNSKYHPNTRFYMDFLYKRLQRKGLLYRDAQRMVNQERNTFAACMVAQGDADAMVSGLTRNHYQTLDEITQVIDRRQDHEIYGMTLLLARGRTLFIADTAVHELPSATQMADMAQHCARVARRWGHEPRVAFISFSNFGNPTLPRAAVMHKAVEELESRDVDFEFDGEMGIDVALNNELRKLYPFCRLSGPANVLIMPGLHVGHATTKLMRELGGATVMGPVLMGLEKPAQIVSQGASVNDLVNMAALAAYQAVR